MGNRPLLSLSDFKRPAVTLMQNVMKTTRRSSSADMLRLLLLNDALETMLETVFCYSSTQLGSQVTAQCDIFQEVGFMFNHFL